LVTGQSKLWLQVAQKSIGDRARAVGPEAAAFDQHGESHVAAVADEPAMGRRVRAVPVLRGAGLAVDPRREPTPAAVPVVTTARIIGRNVSRIPG
jgi:hypothetical protein